MHQKLENQKLSVKKCAHKNCATIKEMEYICNKYSVFVNGPVLRGLSFGHCQPRLSIPVGERITFEAGESGIEL